MEATNQEAPEQANDPFGNTSWTMVRQAQGGSKLALESLIEVYREPIVMHLTRHLGENDGEDATHEYLSGLLNSGYLAKASKEHGKFRAFLLHDLRYFILGWRRKKSAQKRGGDVHQVSFEELIESGAQLVETGMEWQAEKFDRDWTLGLMKKVHSELEDESRRNGNHDKFCAIQQFIETGGTGAEYERVAAELEMTVNNVRVTIHRLRLTFAEKLRELVADTLGPDESIDDELSYLRNCFLSTLK